MSSGRALSTRQRYLTASGVALLLLVVFVNPPTHTTFMDVLHKSAHPAVFALIALISLELTKTQGTDWWRPYVGAFGVVLACGVGTEVMQSFLNRDGLLEDVARDPIGGGASLAIASLVQRSTLMRPSLRLSVVLLATLTTVAAVMPLVWCVAAYAHRNQTFPIILEYRSPLDMYFMKTWTGAVSGAELPAEWAVRPNEKAVEVGLDIWKPGIRLFETVPDWRGYGSLSVEVTNPNATPLGLVVRANAESPDYCDVPFELEPRTRTTLRLRLDEIGAARPCRELNRSYVAGMAIFTLKTTPGGKLYVNRVSLTDAVGGAGAGARM